MKYVYYAVLEPMANIESYYAYVPDLWGCVTSGSNLQDAIEMITDVASIWLVYAEDKETVIPSATPANQSDYKARVILAKIDIDTESVSKRNCCASPFREILQSYRWRMDRAEPHFLPHSTTSFGNY